MDENFIRWHLELAEFVSKKSKDTSTKVGAIIVDPETKKVIGIGYNGFPSGMNDSEDRINNRDIKLSFTIHAEENAIINANRSVRGCVMFVFPTLLIPNCCPHCAAIVAQSGIKKVYAYEREEDIERWKNLEARSDTIFKECGVEFQTIPRESNKKEENNDSI